MRNHIQTRNLMLPKMFDISGAFFAPDEGDVSAELVDGEGVVVVTNNWSFDEPEEWFFPSSYLLVADGQYSRDLFLNVTFIAEKQQFEYQQHIRIIRFKPITVTPNALRLLLGANAEEMPDETFDIYGSYIEISERIGSDLFADLNKSRVANRLITLKTVLDQIPTLQLRLMQSRAVDDHKFTRSKMDFDKLKGDLLSEYETLLGVEFGYEELAEAEPLVTIIGRTDPFTGV